LKILLTGSNGFLGKIIKNELFHNHYLKTLARNNSDYNYDISINHNFSFTDNFDLIIHCAGITNRKVISNDAKIDFLKVNVNGTANLLNSLSQNYLPKYFVLISSVSVYGINEGSFVDEKAPLLAKDAYGASKIKQELLVTKWCEQNDIICTILRLPLIIGESPKGNLKTMINGIKYGYFFYINQGDQRRSMVLGCDVARIIVRLAKYGGTYNLTDGLHPSYLSFAKVIGLKYGKSFIPSLPFWQANLIAKLGDYLGAASPFNSKKLSSISKTLIFDDSKARKLGWKPQSVLDYIQNNNL